MMMTSTNGAEQQAVLLHQEQQEQQQQQLANNHSSSRTLSYPSSSFLADVAASGVVLTTGLDDNVNGKTPQERYRAKALLLPESYLIPGVNGKARSLRPGHSKGRRACDFSVVSSPTIVSCNAPEGIDPAELPIFIPGINAKARCASSTHSRRSVSNHSQRGGGGDDHNSNKSPSTVRSSLSNSLHSRPGASNHSRASLSQSLRSPTTRSLHSTGIEGGGGGGTTASGPNGGGGTQTNLGRQLAGLRAKTSDIESDVATARTELTTRVSSSDIPHPPLSKRLASSSEKNNGQRSKSLGSFLGQQQQREDTKSPNLSSSYPDPSSSQRQRTDSSEDKGSSSSKAPPPPLAAILRLNSSTDQSSVVNSTHQRLIESIMRSTDTGDTSSSFNPPSHRQRDSAEEERSKSKSPLILRNASSMTDQSSTINSAHEKLIESIMREPSSDAGDARSSSQFDILVDNLQRERRERIETASPALQFDILIDNLQREQRQRTKGSITSSNQALASTTSATSNSRVVNSDNNNNNAENAQLKARNGTFDGSEGGKTVSLHDYLTKQHQGQILPEDVLRALQGAKEGKISKKKKKKSATDSVLAGRTSVMGTIQSEPIVSKSKKKKKKKQSKKDRKDASGRGEARTVMSETRPPLLLMHRSADFGKQKVVPDQIVPKKSRKKPRGRLSRSQRTHRSKLGPEEAPIRRSSSMPAVKRDKTRSRQVQNGMLETEKPRATEKTRSALWDEIEIDVKQSDESSVSRKISHARKWKQARREKRDADRKELEESWSSLPLPTEDSFSEIERPPWPQRQPSGSLGPPPVSANTSSSIAENSFRGSQRSRGSYLSAETEKFDNTTRNPLTSPASTASQLTASGKLIIPPRLADDLRKLRSLQQHQSNNASAPDFSTEFAVRSSQAYLTDTPQGAYTTPRDPSPRVGGARVAQTHSPTITMFGREDVDKNRLDMPPFPFPQEPQKGITRSTSLQAAADLGHLQVMRSSGAQQRPSPNDVFFPSSPLPETVTWTRKGRSSSMNMLAQSGNQLDSRAQIRSASDHIRQDPPPLSDHKGRNGKARHRSSSPRVEPDFFSSSARQSRRSKMSAEDMRPLHNSSPQLTGLPAKSKKKAALSAHSFYPGVSEIEGKVSISRRAQTPVAGYPEGPGSSGRRPDPPSALDEQPKAAGQEAATPNPSSKAARTQALVVEHTSSSSQISRSTSGDDRDSRRGRVSLAPSVDQEEKKRAGRQLLRDSMTGTNSRSAKSMMTQDSNQSSHNSYLQVVFGVDGAVSRRAPRKSRSASMSPLNARIALEKQLRLQGMNPLPFVSRTDSLSPDKPRSSSVPVPLQGKSFASPLGRVEERRPSRKPSSRRRTESESPTKTRNERIWRMAPPRTQMNEHSSSPLLRDSGRKPARQVRSSSSRTNQELDGSGHNRKKGSRMFRSASMPHASANLLARLTRGGNGRSSSNSKRSRSSEFLERMPGVLKGSNSHMPLPAGLSNRPANEKPTRRMRSQSMSHNTSSLQSSEVDDSPTSLPVDLQLRMSAPVASPRSEGHKHSLRGLATSYGYESPRPRSFGFPFGNGNKGQDNAAKKPLSAPATESTMRLSLDSALVASSSLHRELDQMVLSQSPVSQDPKTRTMLSPVNRSASAPCSPASRSALGSALYSLQQELYPVRGMGEHQFSQSYTLSRKLSAGDSRKSSRNSGIAPSTTTTATLLQEGHSLARSRNAVAANLESPTGEFRIRRKLSSSPSSSGRGSLTQNRTMSWNSEDDNRRTLMESMHSSLPAIEGDYSSPYYRSRGGRQQQYAENATRQSLRATLGVVATSDRKSSSRRGRPTNNNKNNSNHHNHNNGDHNDEYGSETWDAVSRLST